MDKWWLCSLFFFVHSKSIIACCTTHNFHQAIFILQKWLILFHQVSIVCATFFLTSLYSIFTTLYLSRCPACMMTPPLPSAPLIFSASSSSSSRPRLHRVHRACTVGRTGENSNFYPLPNRWCQSRRACWSSSRPFWKPECKNPKVESKKANISDSETKWRLWLTRRIWWKRARQ